MGNREDGPDADGGATRAKTNLSASSTSVLLVLTSPSLTLPAQSELLLLLICLCGARRKWRSVDVTEQGALSLREGERERGRDVASAAPAAVGRQLAPAHSVRSTDDEMKRRSTGVAGPLRRRSLVEFFKKKRCNA